MDYRTETTSWLSNTSALRGLILPDHTNKRYPVMQYNSWYLNAVTDLAETAMGLVGII